MEILIAILWYLQLLMPGVTYTQTDIEQLMIANQTTIDVIQQDPVLTKKIIEEWEDPPPDPILD